MRPFLNVACKLIIPTASVALLYLLLLIQTTANWVDVEY